MRSGFRTTTRFLPAAFGPTYDLLSARGSLPVEIASSAGVVLDIAAVTESMTLLPFYRPFIPPSQSQSLCVSPAGAEMLARLPPGGKLSISTPRLRYCTVCCDSQHRWKGFMTWLRCHNLPGVQTCWAHGCRLWSLRTPTTATVLPPQRSVAPLPATHWEHWYSNVARNFLLAGGGDALTAHQRGQAWLTVVRERGGSLQTGLVQLAGKFLDIYPADFLVSLKIKPTVEALAPRIRGLTKGVRLENPVFAILLADVTYDRGMAGFLRAAAAFPLASADRRPS